MLVDQKKLDLYVDKNFNVLFEGERGVGKTSIIYKTFEKAGLRVKYFSAPTMDPWTDLVGVPTTITRADGKEVLRLVPPEDFADDKYDVIFIDELNRAPKKVMNALMELIQFKTINGRPYNIKMIWAAINPHNEDEEYHVEPLDPAVEDRFQIKIKFPYKVDIDFFKKSHGQVGEIFCHWWNNQPQNIQKEISPRRLYDAAGFHLDGGDLEDMITSGNVKKLKEDLKSVSQLLMLEKDYNEQKVHASKSVLSKNYSVQVSKYLKSNKDIFEFFLPHIDKEWLAQEFTNKDKVYEYMINIGNSNSEPQNTIAKEIIKDIVSINPSKNIFVKRNLAELDAYLSDELKQTYAELSVKSQYELKSQSSQEATFLNLLKDKDLMNKSYAINATDLKSYNWSTILGMTSKAVSFIQKGELEADRCKLQIAERIGAVLGLYYAQGNINDSAKKTIDSLTTKGHKSYIWTKSNIDSIFADMGEKIKEVIDRYSGLTPEEVKNEYFDLTSSNNQKKQKRKI